MSWRDLSKNINFGRAHNTMLSTRLPIDKMIGEQEIPVALNRAEDAPSLHASRASGRARTAIKK
jgi:hypothetical protein